MPGWNRRQGLHWGGADGAHAGCTVCGGCHGWCGVDHGQEGGGGAAWEGVRRALGRRNRVHVLLTQCV